MITSIDEVVVTETEWNNRAKIAKFIEDFEE